MSKLKERAVAAFGVVSQWSAAQMTDAGAAIGKQRLIMAHSSKYNYVLVVFVCFSLIVVK